MAKQVKKSVAPIYAVGVVWLLWALIFPLYQPVHYAAAGITSLAVYGVGRFLAWRNKEKEPIPAAPKPAAAPAAMETGRSPEVDALRRERDRALGEMRRLNDSIQDPALSAQIDHLAAVTGKILEHVADNPEKLPQIRTFLNYYLPTTLKLLNSYDRMDSAGVAGENIDGAMGRIEQMMQTVAAAFDKQLDALFGAEALDISADIQVFEQMLAREGLAGPKLEQDTTDPSK
ncbi:hypothetical protein D1159_11330 [Pseudoflavonifractor sp. 524-17]|uniref:5-bromo-4-chloroindolyl phosphate hydrolysis family protein n=1 Tax=Pseudoflavonifractor sp. 524-17 TaxID=2304577 RepID=UPI00137B3DE5|nr:5-bromo-4-chloroindolyl phosphate hydrolysis family protein [Pseudoflavonifractor sp. 524-17]NCE65151.1 hypothetical protein [Pseudoflavonifractor sp. 524-17]